MKVGWTRLIGDLNIVERNSVEEEVDGDIGSIS
jgi:hypothetical protein